MATPTATTATTNTTGTTDTTVTDVVIGLDVGTQSTKAVLYDPTSHTVISRSSKSYGLLSTDVDGRAEQDPSTWIDAVHHCLSSLSSSSLKGDGDHDGTGGSCGSRRLRLVGVGVSGQQHGMVCLDADFRVVRPAKLWCDVESAPQARALSERLSELRGEPVNVPPGFTAPKVRWLKENEPENFARTEYILLPHEYVNLVLCGGDVEESAPPDRELSERLSELRGQPVNVTTAPKVGWPREGEPENFARTGGSDERYVASEAGDASGTGVFDTATRNYDLRAAAECVDPRYPSMLPKRLLGPLDTVGELCPEWRRICGLGDGDPPVVISAGSGDNMCSALGCGVVSSTGDAVLSLGTSGTIFGVSDSPVNAVVMEVAGGSRPSAVAPFCDATGKHLPLVCVMSCTGVLNDVLRNMCRRSPSSSNQGSPMKHAEAEELASQVPPGCHGLSFHPYLGGERTPDWPTATGSLVGVTSSNISYLGGENSAGVWYRAALEGISYNLRMALDEMRLSCGPSGGGSGGAAGFDPSGLLVVGGGSTNRLWRRILADVLGMELRFPVESESAALGAAFQAGAAAEAAASAGNSGDILSLGDYIRSRPIRLEEVQEEDGVTSPVVVVKPTDDGTVREAYRVGYKRFVASARGLFGGGNDVSGSNSNSNRR